MGCCQAGAEQKILHMLLGELFISFFYIFVKPFLYSVYNPSRGLGGGMVQVAKAIISAWPYQNVAALTATMFFKISQGTFKNIQSNYILVRE